MHGAFTIDELTAVVRERDPKAGATATVYRAVAAMEAAGYLERVGTRNGSALLTHCSAQQHHHHVVCDRCGGTTHAPCPIELGLYQDLTDTGFVITRHEVTLYGLCADCAGKED